MKPFLKWPGGKRRLVSRIMPHLKLTAQTFYVEPFLGAGAVALEVLPLVGPALLADSNRSLMGLWNWVQHQPEEVFRGVWNLRGLWNSEEDYYRLRDEFNHMKHATLHKAVLMLYLNRTCFNGLWRENLRGEFNVPFGKYKREPAWPTLEELGRASGMLRGATLMHSSFQSTLASLADELSFNAPRYGNSAPVTVYCDPPYDGGFVQYTAGSWHPQDDLRALANAGERLVALGARVVISNSDTAQVRRAFSAGHWIIHEITAARTIAADSSKRAPVTELLIVGG